LSIQFSLPYAEPTTRSSSWSAEEKMSKTRVKDLFVLIEVLAKRIGSGETQIIVKYEVFM
jgi:hypothetical protein